MSAPKIYSSDPRAQQSFGPFMLYRGQHALEYRLVKKSLVTKYSSCLRGLAISGLVFAVLILMLGITCVGIGAGEYNQCRYVSPSQPPNYVSPTPTPGGCTLQINCVAGTAIWLGIFFVITSSVGVTATAKRTGRVALIIYQFMIMVSCCAVLGLIAVNSYYTSIYAFWTDLYTYKFPSLSGSSTYWTPWREWASANLAVDIFILIFAGLYLLFGVLTSSLLCYNWANCCPPPRRHKPHAPEVVYLPPKTVVTHSASPAFPNGAGPMATGYGSSPPSPRRQHKSAYY